jgi:hypothetical protein
MERSNLVNKNQKPKKKQRERERESPKLIFELGERRILVFDLLKDHGFLILVAPLARNFLRYRYLELEN